MELMDTRASRITRSRVHTITAPVSQDFFMELSRRYHNPDPEREQQAQLVGGAGRIKLKVLLVLPYSRTSFENVIQDRGHELTTRSTLEEAINLLRTEKFDVLLTHFNETGPDNSGAVKAIIGLQPDLIIHLLLSAERDLESLAGLIENSMILPIIPLQISNTLRKDEKKILARNQARQEMNILIIHHDPVFVKGDMDLIARKGYKAAFVEADEKNEKALDVCRRKKFDIIFAHFRSGTETGMEFFEKLKNLQPDAIIHPISCNSLDELFGHPSNIKRLPGWFVSNFVDLSGTVLLVDFVLKDEKTLLEKKQK